MRNPIDPIDPKTGLPVPRYADRALRLTAWPKSATASPTPNEMNCFRLRSGSSTISRNQANLKKRDLDRYEFFNHSNVHANITETALNLVGGWGLFPWIGFSPGSALRAP